MKIAVAGTGYVGLSIACLLAQRNEVIALDVIKEKVDMINAGKSPIRDKEIEDFLANKKLDLKATLDYKEAFEGAKFIIISTPTNYNDETKYFDTSSVEDIIEKVISMNLDTTMVIKSTIPVGYVESIKKKYGITNRQLSYVLRRLANSGSNVDYKARYMNALLIYPHYMEQYTENPQKAIRTLKEYFKQIKANNFENSLKTLGINPCIESIQKLVETTNRRIEILENKQSAITKNTWNQPDER